MLFSAESAVLVHYISSFCFLLSALASHSFSLSILTLAAILPTSKFFFAHAQAFPPTLKNGQIFTNALAIIDAPQMNSQQHAGSNLVIAIDVSGDGKIPKAASIPKSGLPYSFDLLNIYLVSAQTSLNFTVSQGPGLLNQEPGSTVKHLNWPIPDCTPPGLYNLTFYENSLIHGYSYFTITSYPVEMLNDAQSGTCTTGLNPLQPQPQKDFSRGVSPWMDPTLTSLPDFPNGSEEPSPVSIIPSATMPAMPGTVTVTVGPTGEAYPLTVVPPGMDATVFIVPSMPASAQASMMTMTEYIGSATTLPGGGVGEGSIQVQTLTVTVSPTPVTVVFVSIETFVSTTTAPGTTEVVTATRTVPMMTTTAMIGPEEGDGKTQFIPVNAALPLINAFVGWICFIPFLLTLVLVFRL